MKSTRKFARWVAPAVTAAIAVLGTSLVYSSMRDTLQIADHGSVNLPLPRDFTMRVIYADSAAVRTTSRISSVAWSRSIVVGWRRRSLNSF
jgi:hypothetical protein